MGARIDPKLLEFCKTDREKNLVEQIIAHGSISAGARAANVNRVLAHDWLGRIRHRAAVQGHSPEHDMTHPAPDSHIVKGVSTLYNQDGQIAAQWVKTDLRKEAFERVAREVVDALKSSAPRAKPVPGPRVANADLLNCFVVTDYHLGMRADGEETRGEDWDTRIAEELLVKWFGAAIAQSPSADTAILAQLGDALHYDSLSAITPSAGHLLDADTRYQRIIRVAVRMLRHIISMLLAKHNQVIVIMAEGNHDMASSAWLREVFHTFYEDEPRVTVDTSPDPYYCVEHGDTAIFFHHGHMKKQTEVDRTFAAKFREVFGRTRHAFAHMGHYHHRKEVESPLMVIRQHRTLAAADAYASRGGFLSGRDAQVITYHKKFGEVGTVTISPEMVA